MKSSETVDVYLGNEDIVDNAENKVVIFQSTYILPCLDRVGMLDCHGVDLPLRNHLSVADQPSTPHLGTWPIRICMDI